MVAPSHEDTVVACGRVHTAIALAADAQLRAFGLSRNAAIVAFYGVLSECARNPLLLAHLTQAWAQACAIAPGLVSMAPAEAPAARPKAPTPKAKSVSEVLADLRDDVLRHHAQGRSVSEIVELTSVQESAVRRDVGAAQLQATPRPSTTPAARPYADLNDVERAAAERITDPTLRAKFIARRRQRAAERAAQKRPPSK